MSPSPEPTATVLHHNKGLKEAGSFREGSLMEESGSSKGSHSVDKASEGGFLSIVVFGASGDLAKKKTFPALFNLYRQGFLPPDQVHIFGYARSSLTDKGLRDRLRGYLKPGKTDPCNDPEMLVTMFLNLVSYVSGPYDHEDGFVRLEEALAKYEEINLGESGSSRRLFYLALPPSVYPVVCKMIRASCMNKCGWNRVVIEKPFGKDLASSELLSEELGQLFSEEEIYRIDHYLGKEIVQNLIVFKEDFGTEGRGGYFDEYGIVRDIIQNHLLQIFCLVAMEKPISLNPEHIRNEKVKVLKSVEPIRNDEVVLGQYKGYLDDPTVPKGSITPTFAAIILRIYNERWDSVPFILKAGKSLDSRKTEIRVQFKDVPGDIYRCQKQGRNEFVMRLQPSEAMYMKLTVKKPGLEMSATQSELDLSYHQRYEDIVIPEAYERLLLDTIRGDQQHFVRRDELRVAWEIFTPLLHRIDKGEFKSSVYEAGSRGPVEADALTERAGYRRTHGYIWKPPSLRAGI